MMTRALHLLTALALVVGITACERFDAPTSANSGTLALATMASTTIVSSTDATWCYDGLDGSSYPVTATDPDCDPTSASTAFQHPAWFDPTTAAGFAGSGAIWISVASDGRGADADESSGPRGVYLYSQSFSLPSTAYDVGGNAYLGADNYGWLSVNGTSVLGPADATQNDRNFQEANIASGAIPAVTFACTNAVTVEVQNGVSIGENGPTGVVFALDLDYHLPHVIWAPPITNADFELKDGTTLPIKFSLEQQDGTPIASLQDVTVAVHNGYFDDPLGTEVESWALGDGVDALRFDPATGEYIANFQTKDHDLSAGEFTAVVHDACTGDVLGWINFDLADGKGNRGNSGK